MALELHELFFLLLLAFYMGNLAVKTNQFQMKYLCCNCSGYFWFVPSGAHCHAAMGLLAPRPGNPRTLLACPSRLQPWPLPPSWGTWQTVCSGQELRRGRRLPGASQPGRVPVSRPDWPPLPATPLFRGQRQLGSWGPSPERLAEQDAYL